MPWALSLLSSLAFVAAGVLGGLAIGGWYRRRRDAAPFVVLMLATMAWAGFYGIQLGSTTVAEKRVWLAATLAASGFVPVILLHFAQDYAGHRGRFTGRIYGLLVGEALVFAGLVVTNPLHSLVWTDTSLQPGLETPVILAEFAAGYYLHIVVAYLVVLAAFWTILSVYFRSASLYRRQAALLLVGAAPALGMHVLYSLRVGPVPGLDLTPLVFPFTGATFGLALFHFDLLDRTPIAQRRAINLAGDGLFVVDADGHVVDSNEIARELYDVEDEVDISALTGASTIQDLDGTTTKRSFEGSQRVYDVYVTDLADDSGQAVGYSVVLRDVTSRDAYEQRLEVTNRILRHNLRNDMNVILGHAELLADLSQNSQQEEFADSIRATAEDLVQLSEKARDLVKLQADQQRTPVSMRLDDVLDPVVAEFREQYPAVSVTVTCPDEATVRAVSERSVTVALRNLLENAAKHNDPASLAVAVEVTVDDGQARISVVDTGSGLPEMEQRVLHGESETPLQHGSGLGLWLTYWIASVSGGDVVVDSADAEGTTITLVLPVAEWAPKQKIAGEQPA